MDLSTELLSQFAKITNREERNKNEVTVYGTIIESDGTKRVQIDGSDSSTPVIMAVDASDGDRVTIQLKNHTATVTGNLSSPSARGGTVEAVIAEIDGIKTAVDLADIASLNALNARLTTVEGKITTVNARIDTLESNINGHIDSANEQYARIDGVETSIETINEDITSVEDSITQINTVTIAELRSLIQGLDQRLTALGG